MDTESLNTSDSSSATESTPAPKRPAPLPAVERRILGVLMEKARTTPDTYPLSLNALVTGCNQKSNRAPLMNLSENQVEAVVSKMRQKQLVAEVHGGGRVPKYRHYGYDYMGVKGVEAGVMAELLLRGEQSSGELRTHASRFDAIADLNAMQQIIDNLMARGLMIALTPPGRGQLFSHNLYEPDELEALQQSLVGYTGLEGSSGSTSRVHSGASTVQLEQLQAELIRLKSVVEQLEERVAALES
jgi:uncharacterized protein